MNDHTNNGLPEATMSLQSAPLLTWRRARRSKIALSGLIMLCALICSAAPRAFADPTPVAKIERQEPVDFAREVLPILRRNCLACHNATEAESDLILEDAASIIKGGGSGPAVIPGNAAESMLLQVAAYAAEPLMPPEDNDVGAHRLTSAELGLLQLWILQGAPAGGRAGEVIDWQPLPRGVNPVYAVAVSADGQFAAAGRANQIFVYHLPSQKMVGKLSDPDLLKTGAYEKPGVAHLDLVQSLRFSPDGSWLASGGYRTVKLWRRAPVRQLSLAVGTGRATSVAISGDGRTVAIGMQNGDIRLLAGALSHTLRGHEAEVSDLQFAESAAGSTLWSASLDATSRSWDLQSYEATRTISTSAAVLSLRLLSNNQLATGCDDGFVRIWDTANGNELSALKGHAGPVTSLASATGQKKHLLSGGADGTVRKWDLQAGTQLQLMKHGGGVRGVAISANGKRVASAGANNITMLWDENGKEVAKLQGDLRRRLEVEAAERIVAVAKRGIENAKADLKEVTDRKTAEEKNTKLAQESQGKAAEDLKKKETGLQEQKAKQVEVEQLVAKKKSELDLAEQGKESAARGVAAANEAMAAAANTLAAAQQAMAEAAEKVKAAEVAQQNALAQQAKADEQFAATQQLVKETESQLAKAQEATKKASDERDTSQKTHETAQRTVGRAQQALKRAGELVPPAEASVKSAEQDLQKQEKILDAEKKRLKESQQPYFAVAFSPDSATLATGGDDHTVRTWDATTGVPVSSYDGHNDRICAIAYSNQGHVVSLSRDGNVSVWNDNAPWQYVRAIGGVDAAELADRVTALDFSPDGQLLATGSGEPSRSGELKIWKVADGSFVAEIEDAHSDTVQCLRFSPDGKQIASSGADRFAKIFAVDSGKFIRAFEGHTHHVLGVTWRADGRQLATGGADNVVKVWDARTGDQKRTITGFTKEVTGVCFLAASDNVVASSGDKSVQLKSTQNGRRVKNFRGTADFMYCIAASANGKTIVGGGEDSVVRVWQDDGKEIVTFAPE